MALRRALLLLAAASAAPRAAAAAAAGGSCPAGSPGCDHSLLQTERSTRVVKNNPVTDNCASMLNEYHTRAAACLVVNDGRVLLVRVPYGSSPGWDLPGGREKGSEPACETAEREVCEETGYSARVISRLSYNVYLCELGQANVCTRAVDEGFLEKRWFSESELDGITMRGNSWGDKMGLIREHIGGSSGTQNHGAQVGTPVNLPGGLDDCGCQRGVEGWSRTYQRCGPDHETDDWEADQCRRSHTNRMIGSLR